MKKNIQSFISIWVLFLVVSQARAQTLTTLSIPPVKPYLNQIFIQGGNGIHVTFQYLTNNSTFSNSRFRVFGSIQRLSPSPFTIELKNITDTSLGAFINVTAPSTRNLNKLELEQAFGNFDVANLTYSGTPPLGINDTLPDGVYNICFTVQVRKKGCCDPIDGVCTCQLPYETIDFKCASFTIFSCTQPQNGMLLNTIVIPPINPIISQSISGGNVKSNIQFTNPPACSTRVKLFGKIQRMSPSPFTIELDPNYQQQAPITINPGVTQLTPNQIIEAFNNFNESNLLVNGINLSSIKDANNNINLPDGNYRICFYARYITSNGQLSDDASDRNLGCANYTISCGTTINTTITAPNPIISKTITEGRVNSTIKKINPLQCSTDLPVLLFGRIDRISPSSFTIATKEIIHTPVILGQGPLQLSATQMIEAFNNFNENNLTVTGINPASIKDANNNIKLPDGSYRICFFARYRKPNGELGDDASDRNLGCASFTLCNQAGGAPQFIQPVTNANISSDISVIQPVSPVIFSWTPPQSTCGLPPSGYTYDLDIWELFPNQTVTDAINNPYVFRKTSLPSTTFPLDLNLNKDVLKQGKRYAIRVRAVSINPNSPVEIDNDGYSRIEAFQYGGTLITQIGVPDPHDYFIEFKERKSTFWDDVRKRKRDTLVPIKEYIAFILMQNGIGYSLDAIELFIALNPDLAKVNKVKISHTPNLPLFPRVSANDQKNFDKEHATDLEPDKAEENKFLEYLDTLSNYRQKMPDNGVKLNNDLVNHLNSIKTQVGSIDRVTVSFINSVLAEFTFQLRLYSRNSNTSQYNHLQKLATTIRELTTESLNSTSFLYRLPEELRSSFSSYKSGPNESLAGLAGIDISLSSNEIEGLEYLPAIVIKQLLPFDVIVYRTGTVAPYKPVLDAPDLKSTFRIYYTLTNLYNKRNPEVNAKTSTRLASTIQVSLPSNSLFSFWTLNMVNHKTTTAEEVDLREILKNSTKKDPSLKKPSIVIKVD